MGSTVTTNKAVAAFKNKAGEVIYVLFEESYEKNCYPHIPSWCCRGIGNFRDVMLKVFRGAAACEGGGLQVRGGPTMPETYIQRWREKFSSPVRIPDIDIEIKLGGTSMYSSIPDSKVHFATTRLAEIGRQDVLEALYNGPVKLSLYNDCDVIIALYGIEGELAPWKVLRYSDTLGIATPVHAPPKVSGSILVPSMAVYLIDQESVLVRLDDGQWRNAGWRYAAVGEYIVGTALDAELLCTGSSARLVKAFREACNTAPRLPGATRISVVVDAAEEKYRQDYAADLAVALNFCESRATAPKAYQTDYASLVRIEGEYLATRLAESQVTWDIPLVPASGTSNGTATTPQPNQAGLF